MSLTNIVQAQDFKSLGIQHVDTLTAPYFWGRAYTNDGAKKAAQYISEQYRLLGALSFGNDYYQEFFIPQVINFPTEVKLSINNKQLLVGKDFIISGNSPTLTLKNSQFTLLDSTTFVNSDKTAIIKLVDKLTFAPKTTLSDLATIEVLKSLKLKDFSDVNVTIETEVKKNYKTQNVIGYIPGSRHIDSFLVISAHYDHIGGYGNQIYFPGANDNASGVAMLLTLMSYYSKYPPEYSIIFIAFSGEEIGLLGSYYFVNNPLIDLIRIKFVMNLDLVGNGSEGITIVNALEFPEAFNLLAAINNDNNYLPKIRQRSAAANSDHYPFYQKNIPSFFMYSQGGSAAYHDIYDNSENLGLDRFNEITQLVIDFFESLSKK